jgi:hypothetical protein
MMRRYFALLVTGSLLLTPMLLPQVSFAVSLPSPEISQPENKPLPNQVARRVKQAIAKQFKVSTRFLKVTAYEARTWDGCFGLPNPDTMCTMIAIPGYQVIVEGQQRRWVYHTNANGSQLGFNQTASLVSQPSQVMPRFIEQEGIPDFPQNVVYQSVESGGFAGRTVMTQLLNDGKIMQQQIAPNIRSRPVLLKQIKPQQVEAFLTEVRQNRLNHLNRLSYEPVKSGADLITTQILSPGLVTEYVDYVQADLPSALKNTIQAWQKLLK